MCKSKAFGYDGIVSDFFCNNLSYNNDYLHENSNFGSNSIKAIGPISSHPGSRVATKAKIN